MHKLSTLFNFEIKEYTIDISYFISTTNKCLVIEARNIVKAKAPSKIQMFLV